MCVSRKLSGEEILGGGQATGKDGWRRMESGGQLVLAFHQRFNLREIREEGGEKGVGHALMPQLGKIQVSAARRRVRASTDRRAACQDGLVKICVRI